MDEILHSKGLNEKTEDNEEVGTVRQFVRHPIDQNAIVFMGTEGFNWYSDDCGQRVESLNHGRNVDEFIFHPMDSNLALAAA